MSIPAWLSSVIPVAQTCLKLALKIAEIVRKNGIDGAGKMRLEDVEGWKEWASDVLKQEADMHLLEELAKAKENLKNG